MNTNELKELQESFNFIKESIDASMESIAMMKFLIKEYFSDESTDVRRDEIKDILLKFSNL